MKKLLIDYGKLCSPILLKHWMLYMSHYEINDTLKKPKWINNDILQLMRERDSYYARARRLNKADDWNIAKLLHNRVQMAIKAHKSNIIKEDLERYKNNPRNLWEKIYEILPKNEEAQINSLMDSDNYIKLGKKQLPNYINRYFSEIGPTLAKNHLQNNPVYNKILHERINEMKGKNLLMADITLDEIAKQINLINVKKSSAIINIKSVVLKDPFDHLKSKLCKIFNASLQ